MAATDRTLTTTGITIVCPQKRVFAFSPASALITGVSANQEVVISWSGGTFKRYTDSSFKVFLPLKRIFQSFFANTEVGDVLSFTGYINSASKLILSDKIITVTIGTNHIDMDFDIIWGALQVGETESEVETIYKFGTLPLTVTQNIGEDFSISTVGQEVLYSSFGKDINIQDVITGEGSFSVCLFTTGIITINKTITIETLPYCENDIYLCWIDVYGQYRYFAFLYGESENDIKFGDSYNKELFNLDPTAAGLYKTQNQVIDVQGNNAMALSVPTATYEQQKFLQGLETALKVYKYLGSDKWVEVIAKVDPIKLDERWKQNKSVNVQIIMPNLYLQSL